MLVPSMSHKEMEDTLVQLDQAIYYHEQWFNDVMRALICKLPYTTQKCPLSEWTLTHASKGMDRFSEWQETNKAHQELHRTAQQLIQTSNNDKPISSEEFDTITASLERFNTAIYAFKKQLASHLTNQIPATITANHITMIPMLREQQEISKQISQPCCLVMVDIDLLNKINIQYGQHVRDNIFISLAHFLVDHVRAYDKVFCYSDDAFIVCLQKVDSSQALELIDRLRLKIAKTAINVGSEEPLYVTVSCGITELSQTSSIDQSIEQSKIALYLAKSSGRNNSKVWNPESEH